MRRERHGRDMRITQTESFVTIQAIEMRVEIVDGTITFITANRIFQRTRPVIYPVYEMVRKKKSNGSENRGPVHCIQIIFQIQ